MSCLHGGEKKIASLNLIVAYFRGWCWGGSYPGWQLRIRQQWRFGSRQMLEAGGERRWELSLPWNDSEGVIKRFINARLITLKRETVWGSKHFKSTTGEDDGWWFGHGKEGFDVVSSQRLARCFFFPSWLNPAITHTHKVHTLWWRPAEASYV